MFGTAQSCGMQESDILYLRLVESISVKTMDAKVLINVCALKKCPH